MNCWINTLQHSKESWKGSKELEAPEEQKLDLIIISDALLLTDKSELFSGWLNMATKTKSRKRLDSIFKGSRESFNSPNISIESFYRYLEQIEENLRRFHMKKARLQQKNELQKIRKDIKKRKAKELENFLFLSRYHNYY